MKSKRKQTTKAAEVPLLEPLELAKLAAILGPEARPANAMAVAMKFYVEAVLFSREHSSKTFEDLFTEFGSDERHRAQRVGKLEQDLKPIREDRLELDPTKNDDAARRYLYKCGIRPRLKTARAVLDNLRRCWDEPLPERTFRVYQRPSVENVIASCARVRDGKKTYELSRSLLESVANYARRRRNESKRRSWRTRKSREKPAQKTGKQKVKKSSV